jgi:glucokinase
VSDRLVGIDVGGTKMMAVSIERSQPGIVFEQRVVPTPSSARGVLDQIVNLAREMGAVSSLGVGLAGLVESGDVLRAAPNLTCMIDVPTRAVLQEELGFPIYIENDATCALLAEMEIGVGRNVSDVVLVTLGTGIGGAIAIGGEIRRGAHGFAGEPGHMCVDPNGPLCVCGRRGCWERYASGAGVVWLAQQRGLASESGNDPVSSAELVARARAGDGDALAVWREFAEWLALGLANLADVLDPEVLLIGGGLIEVADLYLDRTRDRFVDEVLGGRSRLRTRVELAQSGPAAGAIGAALLH